MAKTKRPTTRTKKDSIPTPIRLDSGKGFSKKADSSFFGIDPFAQGNTTYNYGGGKGMNDMATYSPELRSPLLNPENFFLPKYQSLDGSPNIELNTWFEGYSRFQPLVNNLLSLHSTLPISRFGLVGITDKSILNFYEEMAEDLELFERSMEILYQWFQKGEVMPYAWWNEDKNCFTNLTLLNTNYIWVTGHPLLQDSNGNIQEIYEMYPDEYLQQLIQSENPLEQELLEFLDEDIIEALNSNLSIIVDPFSTSLLRRKINSWDLRGTSILTCVLKSLLLEDKMREQMMAYMQMNINPVRIWNVGDDKHMATPEVLEATRNLIQSAQYDPHFNVIGSHLIKLDIKGATGTYDKMKDDVEYIQTQILTGLWANKSFIFCLSDDHEVLTDKGWKLYDDVLSEDKIATFNKDTNTLEYQDYTDRWDFEVDEDMVHIENQMIDHLVTKNHRLLIKKKTVTNNDKDSDWYVEEAGKIDHHIKLPNIVENYIGEDSPYEKIVFKSNYKVRNSYGGVSELEIGLDDYLRLAGYYLSEGYVAYNDYEKKKYPDLKDEDRTTSFMTITQQPEGKGYENMKELFDRLPYFKQYSSYKDDATIKNKRFDWGCGREFVCKHFHDEFGKGSKNKKIPRWILNLKKEKLEILLTAMVDGDGSRIYKKYSDKPVEYRYYTISKELANAVQEIVFKLGYAVKCKTIKRDSSRQTIYINTWSPRAEDMQRSGYRTNPTVYKQDIEEEHYKGRVFCFAVPNHLFVCRRNGKIVITHNSEGVSYNSSSVGMRVLMGRYLPIRAMLENYFYQKIFLPTAHANGFYRRTKAELDHKIIIKDKDREPLIPLFDWRHKQSLLDDQSIRGMLQSLQQASKMPMKVIFDSLDIDYEYGKSWLEKEQNTIFDNDLMEAKKTVVKSAVAGGLQDDGSNMVKRALEASISWCMQVLGRSPNIQIKSEPLLDDAEATDENPETLVNTPEEGRDNNEERGNASEDTIDTDENKDTMRKSLLDKNVFSKDYTEQQIKNVDKIIRKHSKSVKAKLDGMKSKDERLFTPVQTISTVAIKSVKDELGDNIAEVIKNQIYNYKVLFGKESGNYVMKTSSIQSHIDNVLNYNEPEYKNSLVELVRLSQSNIENLMGESCDNVNISLDKYSLKETIADINVADKDVLKKYWESSVNGINDKIMNNLVSVAKETELATYNALGYSCYVNGELNRKVDNWKATDSILPDTKFAKKITVSKRNFIATAPIELKGVIGSLVDKYGIEGRIDLSNETFNTIEGSVKDLLINIKLSNLKDRNDMMDLFSKYYGDEESEEEWFRKVSKLHLDGYSYSETDLYGDDVKWFLDKIYI